MQQLTCVPYGFLPMREHEPASFGEGPPARGANGFGTQHLITGQWVRLGSRFAGELARFLDPFSRDRHWLRLVLRSLASFEARRNWLRSGKTPHSEHHSFSEPNASELVLASFGETAPRTQLAALKIGGHTAAIMQSGRRPFSWDRVTFRGHDDSFGETVRAIWRKSSIGTNCQRAVHARTPASSSGDAVSASGKSVEEGWRRRGGHRCQVFDRAFPMPFPVVDQEVADPRHHSPAFFNASARTSGAT